MIIHKCDICGKIFHLLGYDRHRVKHTDWFKLLHDNEMRKLRLELEREFLFNKALED